MAQANDSVLVTPGSGATIATHLQGSKEYQVIIKAEPTGHLLGSRPIYIYNIATQVHVAAASTIHWDLWNADTTLVVRVLSIRQKPDIVTAVTGVATNWTMQRTSAIGTGGSAQTAVLPDTTQTALSANITCRSKPTGGATASTSLKAYTVHSEETNAGTIMLASLGGLELVPLVLFNANTEQGIRVGPSQGISVTQTTNSAAGNTGWEIIFTVE